MFESRKKILLLFLLVFSFSLFGIFYSNQHLNRDVKKLKEENKVNKKQFSMYVKKSMNGDYEEYTESEYFPNSSKYTFNKEKSYCEDSKNIIVNDAISYVNGKVTVTSGKTIYCYLYFDKNLIDFESDILVQSINGTYKSYGETPQNNLDYTVRYDCNNNDAITSFGYDYTINEYVISTSSKNVCNIYFDTKAPDVKIIFYVNDEEVSELSSEVSYVLDETLSTCTNSDAIIEYDDSTKDVIISTGKQTVCNVYLEGE